MANYATLKAAIQNVIRANGNQEITGNVMQQTLLSMITSLGQYFQYAGVAVPSTNPGTPDPNVFYLASETGTYSNFDALVVNDGELCVFSYNGTWHKDVFANTVSTNVVDLDYMVKELDKYKAVGPIESNGQLAAYVPGTQITSKGTSVLKYYRAYKGQPYNITANLTYTNTNWCAVGFVESNEIPAVGDNVQVIHKFAGTESYNQNYTPTKSGWIVLITQINNTQTGTNFVVRSLTLIDFQSEIDALGNRVTKTENDVTEISNAYRSDNVLSPGGTYAGQVSVATGKFTASQNYVNRYYAVAAGKRVNITGTITYAIATIAFAAFFPGSSLPVQNNVLTVIKGLTAGSVNEDFTPPSDGYLLVMYTINNTSVASNVVVKQRGNYIDFQSEIDAANAQIGLNRSGLSALENNVEPLFVYTQENENYTGRFGAYINANSGTISAQDPSTGRYVRYYRVLAGSKYKIRAYTNSGNAIYTFLAFYPGNTAPVAGNTVTVLIAYAASGLNVNTEYTAPSDGYILLGFMSTQFEMQSPTIGTWSISDKKAIDFGAEIALPSKIVALVGDTIQVFKRSITKAITPAIYDLQTDCPIGADYPRYFELTPVAGNIGTKTLKFTLRNFATQIFDEKSCSLIVHAAPSNPGSMKRIAVFGDSLTQGGQWVVEAVRRLLSNDAATPTMPAGNGLTNIKFIGAMGDGNARYYGVGGWSWKSYTEAGAPAFRFQVTGVSTIVKGAVYSNNNHQYTIVENNTTGGVGNILCETGSDSYTPQSSGVLTKVSGNGDATITFTSAAADAKNPLWDSANNQISFTKYLSNIGESSLDCVVFLLGWNTIGDVINGFVNQRTYIETLLSALHTQYPSAKVKIMGLQLPSLNGGLGANYGASGTYAEKFNVIRSVFAYNEFLENLCAESAYNSFVEYVDVMTQFDSENNMPEAATQVNTRNAKTEERGTNGVHPDQTGYLQIADVIYRCIVNNYC